MNTRLINLHRVVQHFHIIYEFKSSLAQFIKFISLTCLNKPRSLFNKYIANCWRRSSVILHFQYIFTFGQNTQF